MSMPDPTENENVAAKMRQVAFAAGILPREVATELATAVLGHRPWRDEDQFGAALRAWADEYWGEGSLEPRMADGAAEVAAELARIGRASNPPTDSQALGIVYLMLRNVALGRAPRGYDMLRDHVRGVPARTLPRYRQIAREAGADPGIDALPIYVASLQYRLDLDALVMAGRTVAAARRWLQRHPGKHASDAPPPRPKRLAPPTGGASSGGRDDSISLR